MSLMTAARDTLAMHPRLDGMFRRLIWSRVHFPEIEQKLLSDLPSGSIDVAVDVGAALGPYSWVLSRKAKTVFAFEPGEVHGRYLELNTRGTNITLVRAAAGDSDSTVDMFTAGTDTNALHSATLSRVNPVASQSDVRVGQVRQTTLDRYFAEALGQNRSVDVLKVDVEGYENAVFRGAQAMIAKHHPLIICEIEVRHNPKYGDTFSLLRSLGYACYFYKRDRFHHLEDLSIQHLQTEQALAARLGRHGDAAGNSYINNFVFQHPFTRVKIVPSEPPHETAARSSKGNNCDSMPEQACLPTRTKKDATLSR